MPEHAMRFQLLPSGHCHSNSLNMQSRHLQRLHGSLLLSHRDWVGLVVACRQAAL